MTTLIIGLLVFLGVHSVAIVGTAWRDRTAKAIGEKTWQAIYSVIALIGLVLVVRGYGLARLDPIVIYVPPLWLRDIAVALMIFVFPLLLAAYLPGKIKTTLRNNSLLAATKLWATLHLLANGMLADIVLFGSILAWAVAVRVSLKYRTARTVPALPPSRWNDGIAVAGGLALYAAFILGGHTWLIGVPASARWF
jgi:uncharacterized membrane protein